MSSPPLPFATLTVDELTIEDQSSFRHVALFGDLKEVLHRAKYPFRVLPAALEGRGDRALLLNLTFWGADGGGDVLETDTIPADVVAHAAWHYLAARALPAVNGSAPSVASLFLGEAIASAFDVYLVGRLLGHAKSSTFLETQVPAMADTCDAAGLDEDAFESMLKGIAGDPERAFTDLRELLYDATTALFRSKGVEEAALALSAFDAHRFGPLLHRYELSNWVLYARAYGDARPDERASAIDQRLRTEALPLEWLAHAWLTRHLSPATRALTAE